MRPKIPYGYRIVNGRAEPDPVEAPRLQALFACLLAGESIAGARRLSGVPRSRSCCRKLLSDPVYLGTDYYPRLIAPEMLREAEERMETAAAPYVGRAGKPRARPAAIQTRFAMDRPGGKRGGDPAERAVQMYAGIRTRRSRTSAPKERPEKNKESEVHTWQYK